jgi:sodium/potassium/calcium exchanger 6
MRLSTGLIGAATISLFFTMYGLFVCLVLVADIYHRAVVLPRLARATATVADGETMEGSSDNSAVLPPPSALTRVMTAISNYDDEDVGDEGLGISSAPQQQGQTLVGPLVDDGPILLHGQHGILHGDGHVPAAAAAVTIPESPDGGGVYTLVEDQMDNICAGEGTSEPSATNWSGGLYDCTQEVKQHINQSWEDVAWNGDLHPAEKFLLFLEFPFTILRKVRDSIVLGKGAVIHAIVLTDLIRLF